MITFSDYISYIKKGKLKKRIKIEWLRNEDETPYDSFTANVLSGNLTISKQNGIRRSVNLTLENISGKYIPNEYGIWIRTLFRLYIGFNIDGEDFFLPQGIFVLSEPEVVSNFAETTVNIAGVDKFSLLDGSLGGNLDYVYQIPINTNIYTSVKAILNESKDVKSPTLHHDFINEISPYTVKREAGGNLSDVLDELAGLLSANIFYNEDGHFVFEKDIDDKTKGSVWDFTTSEFAYMGATHKYNFADVYNAVRVVGANIDGQIFDAVAVNDNLQSNTRVQLIGKRTKVITDDNINTNDRALTRAKYELKQLIAVQSSITIKSILMPHLTVDEVITLTDKNLKLDKERFVIQSINMSFETGGDMSISCVKADDLGFLSY